MKFQKQLKKTRSDLEADGYTVAVQDEAIVMAEARARKGVYTLKHKRAVFTYNGNHAMSVVFGLITGEGFFGRYNKFTKEGTVERSEGCQPSCFFGRYNKFTREEFTTFIQNAHRWFGKLLI